jgi:hypothetical protein
VISAHRRPISSRQIGHASARADVIPSRHLPCVCALWLQGNRFRNMEVAFTVWNVPIIKSLHLIPKSLDIACNTLLITVVARSTSSSLPSFPGSPLS